MRFEFATANRIVFGPGTVSEVAPASALLGRKALFVVGKSSERASAVMQSIMAAGVATTVFHVVGEPSVMLVQQAVDAARAGQCDMVISMGGGSVIDAGKAAAALVANPGGIEDYLEVVGEGQALGQPSLPFVAIPTTAGTGSEATRNAVLTVPEKKVKVSLRGPSLLPRLAVVDPTLTFGLPKDVTAASGMDALAQLIEPFVSRAANPMTDAVCREGMRRVAGAIRSAYEDGANAKARADMSVAALFSGMALANAKLGAVHGFAGPIGGALGAPHGAICARLLPEVMEANVAALRKRASGGMELRRFEEVARLLTGRAEAFAEDGVAWLRELCSDLGIKPLGQYGLQDSMFPGVIEQAARSSSIRGNPIELTGDELSGILQAAM